MANAVVGVDLGSSSARAVAIDRTGRVLADGAARYEGAAAWPRGHADPFALLDAFERATARLGLAYDAVAVGGQSPTTVRTDGRDALTCLHAAGIELDPTAQHREQLRVLEEECAGVEPMQLWDWVLVQLGAPRGQGRWPGDPELPGYGPTITTGAVAGEANGTHGVPPGTLLVPGAQDAYLAFWAAGIDEAGRALDPGGRTGGLGVAVAAGARPDDMFALPAAARGIDIVGGPVSAHGLVVDWWAQMTGHTVDELLALAADVPPGARGVLALPYLEGERAPRWDRRLRAELVGLSSDTGPADVARALLESTAYGLAHIARELEARGVHTSTLVVGGSPARSTLWCEIKAAVLEVPVEVTSYPELASYGAALAAGAALGWWPAPGQGGAGDWPRPGIRVITPLPDAVYRDRYRQFVELGDDAVRRLARCS
jgi:sugar (pentulose or hexulose) kinase